MTRSAAISLSSTGGQTDIALQLTIDLHNLRAGGVLDPEGVGAEVYAREMRPEAALANRRAAVATHPEHPRCQLQLSRALQAVSDFDGARNALVAAARAGKSALPSAARSLRSRYKPSAKA